MKSVLVLLAHKVYGLLPRVGLDRRGKAGHVGHLARVLGVDGAVLSGEYPGDEQFARGVIPESYDGEGSHAADSSADPRPSTDALLGALSGLGIGSDEEDDE